MNPPPRFRSMPSAGKDLDEVYEKVTHVVVGFSKGLLTELDRLVPTGVVLLLEEPQVAAVREVRRRLAMHACVAGLVELPTQDEELAERLPAELPRPPSLRVVLPGVEYGVVAAAALAAAWHMPGAGVGAARALRDKASLRTVAGLAGIPQPEWRLVEGPEDVSRFRAEHGGSCVLKPTNRQASLGVQLLGPGDDVAAAWRRTVEADEPRMRASARLPARYLAEQRLTGPELSVEMIVQRGRAVFQNITAKSVLAGRNPVELGHVVPAALPDSTADQLSVLMSDLIGATGFRDGVLHAEWILRDGVTPTLVECAARIPGDRIDELIDLAYDDHFVANVLAALAGDVVNMRLAAVRHAAIRFLTAEPGIVTSVRGTARAAAFPGVLDVVPAVAGKQVHDLSSSWERAGHVVTVGDTAAEAAERAERAAAAIRVDTGTEMT